jgi:hypothetical protein
VKYNNPPKGGGVFKITVHYPQKAEQQKELAKRAAETYAQAVAIYIGSLSCPKEQKFKLYNEVLEAYRNR